MKTNAKVPILCITAIAVMTGTGLEARTVHRRHAPVPVSHLVMRAADKPGGGEFDCPAPTRVIYINDKKGRKDAYVGSKDEYAYVEPGHCVEFITVGRDKNGKVDGSRRPVIKKIHFLNPDEGDNVKKPNDQPWGDYCFGEQDCVLALGLPQGAGYRYRATLHGDEDDKDTDPELDVGCTPPSCSDEGQRGHSVMPHMVRH